ncbi:ketosamine-3-kinase-like [Babylonia areolata]|uniref:ketosamine-3-kinase-like n=1 Tax=Babylonia areolata TaxID=304850 RepID=UPI003FD07599
MAAKAAGDSELTELLKKELNTSKLKFMGRSGGGCISEGKTCDTDSGKVFIKTNMEEGAKMMFDGEVESLEAIIAVGVVKAPKPIKVVSIPSGGAAFVMENLDIVGSLQSKAATLGDQLARLHRHNAELAAKDTAGAQSVHKGGGATAVKEFGFPVTTCCGYIPQNNEWTSTWEELYARKLDQQITLIQKEYNDREAGQEWAVLQRNIPKFFTGLTIVPALLHGDLWSGNAGETADEPVIFDPSSFYGHSEYDLGIATMFGGFSQSFFDSYFKVLPREKGFDSRFQLYQLFHYLNHWNHFGTGYKHRSMNIFRTLNMKQM